MNTSDHIARAQAIHDQLVPIRTILERQGYTVTLMLASDQNIAGVIFGVVVKGTLEAAQKKVSLFKALARSRGFELSGGVIELFRHDLSPDEWCIGLHSIVHRSHLPRRKVA